MIARRTRTLATVLCLVASAARAAPNEPGRAEQLFDEAKALMQANDYANACPKLEESQRVDPQLGTQLHLGYCYEKSGQLARAYQAYRAAEKLAAQRKEPREQVARERATNLAAQLSSVELRPVEPLPELQLTLDDTLIDRADWSELMLEPGQHTLVATAPGREGRQQVVTVGAPGHQTIVVPALAPRRYAEYVDTTATPQPEPEPVPQPRLTAAETPSPPSDPGHVQRTAGYITLAAGVAALGAGTVFGLMRNSQVSELDRHCNLDAGSCIVTRGDSKLRERIESVHDRAQTYATLANVGLIVGGLAIAGGLVLVLTTPKRETPALSLSVAPGGLVLTAHTRGM